MNVCLVVIDGWGISDEKHGNAIANAETPVMEGLCKDPDWVTLDASGLSVGLPKGLMGNSEVGHLSIGAGRVLYQSIVMIDLAIENGSILTKPAFVEAFTRAKDGNGRLHLLGLVSDGGVHSHINHLKGLLDGLKERDVPKTFIQFFSDGRDTSPVSGVKYIQEVLDHTKNIGYGSLATVVGRYYAMDRDKRYERIKIAYEGLVQGIGEEATTDNIVQVVQSHYDAPEKERVTDEFLKPIVIDPEGRIRDGDTLIFFDFRSDRMRQIVEALGMKPQFETAKIPDDLGLFCMTEYKKDFPFHVIFPPEEPVNVLAEWLANRKIPQFHCAETEKYAHVTFFFNGGRENKFEGEDRCLVPSPKVATYDLQPEMSCQGVADNMVETIKSKKYPFVMCNFAPPDMVGHTGIYEAAVKACTATDKAIGDMKKACEENDYVLLVTADHGNAEVMIDSQGNPVTKHTTKRVPFCMHGGTRKFQKDIAHNAALPDVAPTVLELMGQPIPPEMKGKSLIES